MRISGRALTGLVAGAAVVAWAEPARAGNLDFSGYAAFGFAGEAEIDYPGTLFDGDVDLEATVGFGVGVDYQVWDYIDVGGRTSFLWHETEPMHDNSIDRNLQIDIDALIKGQYPFFDGQMEVYLAIPVGLTIGVFSDEFEERYFPGLALGTPVGMNLGVLAGFSYAFLDFLGAFVEMGWQFHWFEWTADGGMIGEGDYETTANQFGLQFGVFYRL